MGDRQNSRAAVGGRGRSDYPKHKSDKHGEEATLDGPATGQRAKSTYRGRRSSSVVDDDGKICTRGVGTQSFCVVRCIKVSKWFFGDEPRVSSDFSGIG